MAKQSLTVNMRIDGARQTIAGDEIVRVVRFEIGESTQGARRRVSAGAGGTR